MLRLRVLVLAAVAAALVVPAAHAKTKLPTKAQGSGNEPTAGGGVMPGKPFAAHYALVVLDISFDQIELFLFPKKVACSDVNFATPPFVDVIVETQGAPILIGKPSLQNGHAFVQAEFHPTTTGSKFFALQLGSLITFTHVDPKIGSVWHGTLTVKKQTFEHHTFSYDGTFAAVWCGKD
jgi:NADH:ubiquinone oxidoreductase subunit 3 (subunit A)